MSPPLLSWSLCLVSAVRRGQHTQSSSRARRSAVAAPTSTPTTTGTLATSSTATSPPTAVSREVQQYLWCGVPQQKASLLTLELQTKVMLGTFNQEKALVGAFANLRITLVWSSTSRPPRGSRSRCSTCRHCLCSRSSTRTPGWLQGWCNNVAIKYEGCYLNLSAEDKHKLQAAVMIVYITPDSRRRGGPTLGHFLRGNSIFRRHAAGRRSNRGESRRW